MASVFLSYDRDDMAKARSMAAALEESGHSVWWDHNIRGGAQFSKVIEEALQAANAIVVLWSKNSVESAWVRDEAAAGRDRGILIPVRLDRTEPPLGFRQFQSVDLSGWRGRKSAQKLRELLQAIDGTAPISAPYEALAPASKKRRRKIGRMPVLVGTVVLLVALAAVALLVWRPWSVKGPSIAISAADGRPASGELARQLLTALGESQAANSSEINLVGADKRGRASLGFEVTAAIEAGLTRANLVLLDERTRGLLWSKAFEPATPEDLQQELSFTAARVLRCALEAYPDGRLALKGDTLKVYLNGCSAFSDEEFGNIPELLPAFRQVVAKAPHFEDGWSKLIMTESQAYVNTGNPQLRPQLARDIESARALNPRLPAIFAAEMDMLPNGAWSEKLAIADRGIAANPTDAWLLGLRAEVLGAVGRVRDAADDLRTAAHSDPLSPQVRGLYANALGAAGQVDAGLSEIEAAERMWPDSRSIAHAKFQLNFDYGDPKFALRVIRSGVLQGGWTRTEPFMEARIDPKPAKVAAAIDNARASYQRDPDQHMWLYVQVLSVFNRYADLLNLLMTAPIDRARSATFVTFPPWPVKFWHNPQSFAYAHRVGLIRYWQSSGKWPDFCFDPDLPFDCKKEASKLSA
jgi:tetratricopeptide (TPR) repeat protein